MTWEICNEGLSEYDSFDIDNEEPEDFCDFLKKIGNQGKSVLY